MIIIPRFKRQTKGFWELTPNLHQKQEKRNRIRSVQPKRHMMLSTLPLVSFKTGFDFIFPFWRDYTFIRYQLKESTKSAQHMVFQTPVWYRERDRGAGENEGNTVGDE